MTVAICLKCGAMKFGAFIKCAKCGVTPKGEDDMATSLVLSDHYQSQEMLKNYGEYIASGKPFTIAPETHQKIVCTIRKAYRIPWWKKFFNIGKFKP